MQPNEIWGKIKEFDQSVLHTINGASGSLVIDNLMVAVSSHSIWLAILTVWLIYAYRNQYRYWYVIIGLLVFSVGLADLFAYQVLKPFFGRMRPCKVDEMVQIVHSCGGKFSFPSNHATNSMVVAGLMFWWASKPVAIVCLAFAVLVGVSRVYLGVHYPLDILFGFFLGLTWSRLIVVALKNNHWLKKRLKGAF